MVLNLGLKELKEMIHNHPDVQLLKIESKAFLKLLKILEDYELIYVVCLECNEKYHLSELIHQANALLCPNCLENSDRFNIITAEYKEDS